MRRFGPAGPEVGVFRGAAAAAERGARSDAVDGMAAALRLRPLHLIAIAPVTNIASLFLLHPELASRVLSITMVGGRTRGLEFLGRYPKNDEFCIKNDELLH